MEKLIETIAQLEIHEIDFVLCLILITPVIIGFIVRGENKHIKDPLYKYTDVKNDISIESYKYLIQYAGEYLNSLSIKHAEFLVSQAKIYFVSIPIIIGILGQIFIFFQKEATYIANEYRLFSVLLAAFAILLVMSITCLSFIFWHANRAPLYKGCSQDAESTEISLYRERLNFLEKYIFTYEKMNNYCRMMLVKVRIFMTALILQLIGIATLFFSVKAIEAAQ